MSANPRSNIRVQRRRRQQRPPSLLSVTRAPTTRVNPDTEFVFQRRTVDLTCWIDTTGNINANFPVGVTATPMVVFGAPAQDVNLPTQNTNYAPFAFIGQLACLADGANILAFFNEWQLRAVKLEFQTMLGDSAQYAGSGVPVPEVVSAVDPAITGTPSHTIANVQAYGNTVRSVLSSQRSHTMRFQPRPAIASGTPVSNIAIPGNSRDLWFPTDMPYYGAFGVIRNWLVPAMAQPVFPVRISATFEIAARRPR